MVLRVSCASLSRLFSSLGRHLHIFLYFRIVTVFIVIIRCNYAVRRQILLVTLSPCRFLELTIRTHCLSHCENSFFLSINLQSS